MSFLHYQITNSECLSFVIVTPLEYNTKQCQRHLMYAQKMVSAALSCSDYIFTGLPSGKELLYSVRNFGSEEGQFWSISSKIRKLVEMFFYQFMY